MAFVIDSAKALAMVAAFVAGGLAYATLPGWATATLCVASLVGVLVIALCRSAGHADERAHRHFMESAERLGRKTHRSAGKVLARDPTQSRRE